MQYRMLYVGLDWTGLEISGRVGWCLEHLNKAGYNQMEQDFLLEWNWKRLKRWMDRFQEFDSLQLSSQVRMHASASEAQALQFNTNT